MLMDFELLITAFDLVVCRIRVVPEAIRRQSEMVVSKSSSLTQQFCARNADILMEGELKLGFWLLVLLPWRLSFRFSGR